MTRYISWRHSFTGYEGKGETSRFKSTERLGEGSSIWRRSFCAAENIK
jgi:hypothetical protein